MNNYTRRIYFKQEEVEQSGPSVNSNDIDQRISARRIRIQNRIEMRKPEEASKQKEEAKEIPLSEKQIDLSSKHISKLVRDGDAFISNIRVACDARENLRRIEEDELNQHRTERLEWDANVGMETFNKITSEWENMRASDIPQNTRDLLADQKLACADLIEEKNKLINELNLEIKAKDDHFVRELGKRREDIELLSQRMESQIQAMQRTYREELAAIEAALIAQKDKLVTEQNTEWEMLMHEIKQKQINHLDQHQKRVEEFDHELNELRTKHSEEYNALKISLETEVETLELQLLKLKATYQLNLEKLEYNFQVLKRRDEENTITKSSQKRKITRLQDTLNNLHNKAIKQEKQYSIENEQLSEDYKKRMENFKDLQKKSKLLIEAEHKNFREIWIMNEEELKDLSNKLLEASRVISEQQLGIPWRKPDVTFMCNVGPLIRSVDQITCKPPAVIAMQYAFQQDAERMNRIRLTNEKNTVPKSLRDVSPDDVRDFLQLLCYEPVSRSKRT
ncbi:Coiled coil domain containing protein [Fasciolopsis buskii]|uniref:Coiled coil domain containing protein n=1 Tax=Fasciolopsis buskii TaxID=27845 RepID=A0A8E0VKH0_9TREM|nr:Coiled coil domain containing protein [Fasciolopsis buski]